MAPPIFAHLHSSPLVVRRSGANWRSLSAHASVSSTASGLEPVELIDVRAERRLLLRTLRESGRRLRWRSEVADLHAFRTVLSLGCRALHFSGHGVPGQVIFETRRGEAQFVSMRELRELLLAGGERAGESSSSSDEEVHSHRVERGWVALDATHKHHRMPLQLVFVSACHSESVAQAFVSAGVPHVVVVSKEEKVLDRKAMEFAKAFYTALFAGHSVAKSFQIGRVQADIAVTSGQQSTEDRSEFKLMGDGDHNDAPFRDVPMGDCVETDLGGRRRAKPSVNECDAVAEVFVGRSLEVHQVYKSLVEGARLVSITGERGMGKTEVALQCAQYATERRIFSHIFYLRLGMGEGEEDPSADGVLVDKFAKCLGLQAASLEELAEQARQRCESENDGDESSFLLILDGCNRPQRQNARFRAIVAMLLRRVSSLAVLLTGDGKFGAMDGVGEKIISVGPLPPADAALLFTLRAPRKIKAHEMGGSTDLEAFGEHPIIKSLRGHPRTICAVSQFLEKKDMELDQHEFLNYIIPSVNTGLCMSKFRPVTASECGLDGHQHSHDREMLALAQPNPFDGCYPHHHHHHHHSPHPSCVEEDVEYSHQVAHEATLRRMKPVASQSDIFTAKSPLTLGVETTHINNGDAGSSTSSGSHTYPLISSRSEPSLTEAMTAPATSLQQLCLLKVADHVRPVIQSESGSLVWARAVVINSHLPANTSSDGYSAAVVRDLQSLRDVPLDWIAPQVSCFFAAKLKGEAVKRPLSSRSIDFLSKSSLIWGYGNAAPAQRGGAVSLPMFSAFWGWFRPLIDCISYSTLWSHTQPRLLHGFLSKGACVSMLERAPPGTFLLRFSETRMRCLVIAYVREDQCVQFVPVTWQPDRSGWFVALQGEANSGNSGVTFSTLQELILSVNVLKFLFPQTPKEAAFTLHG